MRVRNPPSFAPQLCGDRGARGYYPRMHGVLIVVIFGLLSAGRKLIQLVRHAALAAHCANCAMRRFQTFLRGRLARCAQTRSDDAYGLMRCGVGCECNADGCGALCRKRKRQPWWRTAVFGRPRLYTLKSWLSTGGIGVRHARTSTEVRLGDAPSF